MIREIQSKKILSVSKFPDNWFGVKYVMNLYKGCEHACIYCDSRSECYRVEGFDDEVLVKINAVELLDKELSSKRRKGIVGTGAMSDPYTFVERQYGLTSKALKTIAKHRYPLHIMTKSDMIVKDIEALKEINKVYALVAFTVTTSNDDMAEIIEPFAPRPSKRFKALKMLSKNGIYCGISMMPVLPFVLDNKENIREIIKKASDSGAKFVIPWFGVTLRDRQRAYFYKRLDKIFLGVKEKYKRTFKDTYSCNSLKSDKLYDLTAEFCEKYGLIHRMEDVKKYEDSEGEQLSLV